MAKTLGLESVEELEAALDSMDGIAEDGGELESDNIAREARVRSAYLGWCKDNGKKPDESRFPAFSNNFLTMENYSKETGKEMILNKYADFTEAEYKAMQQQQAAAASPKPPPPAAAAAEKISLSIPFISKATVVDEEKTPEQIEAERKAREEAEAQRGKDAKSGEQGQKPGSTPKPGEGEKPGEGQPKSQMAEGTPKGGEGKKPGEGESKSQMAEGTPKGGEGEKPGEGQSKGQMAEGAPKGGEGEKPGEGQSKGQMAEGTPKGGEGEKPGEGQSKGQTAEGTPKGGEGEKPGEGQSKGQMAEGTPKGGEGQKPGEGEGGRGRPQSGQAANAGAERESSDQTDSNTPRGLTTTRDSDNDRRRPQINGGAVPEALFFDDSTEVRDEGVFTGDGYERWSDRLRNVEELLNNPELRNEAAKILDRARQLRVDLKRSNEAPQVAALNQRITQPLIELRDRVAEELAKRDAGKNLAPVDRDPVPAEFRDLVKRYYKELGAGK